MFIRAYLRASTKEQDASRAEKSINEFAKSKGHAIANTYIENESGRTLQRPELKRLIKDSQKGDIILVESIDRLTRLNWKDWNTLKQTILENELKIVAVDLPTSYQALSITSGGVSHDEMTHGILNAVNNMLIDILATMASKDYTMRRERAEQGMKRAKKEGKLTGRPVNAERNEEIKAMLENGRTYTQIQTATGASRTTIAKLKREVQQDCVIN